ncbi:hypothetical protein EZV62_015144 [Acer yangbiense]|uniref:Protein CPR-5 n=1 Tax=Acer yangbiense TaxID=1000413 RepID=A0A5C7HU21_9ROSI|nr:hypothetical protein EZV62_015144 [Acer yangbiense]
MDAPPPPPSTPKPQLHQSTACVSTENAANPIASDPNPTVEDPPPSSKPVFHDKKSKKTAPSSSSCCSSSSSTQRANRVALKRRSNPKIKFGAVRRNEGGDMEAIALPLGMSFAAVVAQKQQMMGKAFFLKVIAISIPFFNSLAWFSLRLVLERKDAAGDKISIDHLSRICTSAVRESLTNVFGDKFDFFARNFEKSFGTTLRTLTLINEGGCHLSNLDTSTLDMTSNENGCTNNSDTNYCHSESEIDFATIATQDVSTAHEEVQEELSTNFINKELVLHGQNNQLICASSGTLVSVMNQSMLSTIEKSVVEQVRSNDLKTLELGLVMERMKLKKTQLALNHDSNHLERTKASFKVEKFKTQLEDTRYSELLRNCIDCLVAGIVTMSASLLYAAYVHSYKKISEATAACTPSSQESKSWWIPNTVSSFNSGWHTIKCQVQVVSRMLFGFLMIITITYLLLQRSGSSSRQTMPITFILLLLGFACGFAGKLCIDTLGGSGYLWLIYWESLCLVHFFANVWTSALFRILHGPVNVSQCTKGHTIVPYWIRRSLFYATMLLFLPLVCGLLPFASLGKWIDHFVVLVFDYQSSTSDWDEL